MILKIFWLVNFSFLFTTLSLAQETTQPSEEEVYEYREIPNYLEMQEKALQDQHDKMDDLNETLNRLVELIKELEPLEEKTEPEVLEETTQKEDVK